MRIIYMGSPACAIPPLQHLLTEGPPQGFQVVAVVSQPAKIIGRGRKKEPSDPPLAQFAKTEGLLVLQPEKAKDPSFLNKLKELAPDIIVTCAYGQILSDEFLAIPMRATINIHPSRLPQYRGATPVPATLLAGESKTAISILFTVRKLDAGALISQKETPIAADETADGLLQRLFCEAGPLLLEALNKLKDPSFTGTPQDENAVSHCGKILKDDGNVSWSEPNQTIYNRFRALFPWPGSYTFLGDKRIVLEELKPADPARVDAPSSMQQGGFYFDKPLSALMVKTGDGWIAVKKLKPAGSRSLEAHSFWNGLQAKEQLRFGQHANTP